MLPQSHDPRPRSRQSHRQYQSEAKKLFAIFANHQAPTDRIKVVTSQWALTEAHSVIYKNRLWANKAASGNDPRKLFPPHSPSLQDATKTLQQEIQQLKGMIDLDIDQPSQRVWMIAQQLSEECGIYAPDCLHLATALQSGCDLLVTQDIHFLNLIHHFRNSVIAQILQNEFKLTQPPNLQACPLLSSHGLQSGVLTARQYLAQLGYT